MERGASAVGHSAASDGRNGEQVPRLDGASRSHEPVDRRSGPCAMPALPPRANMDGRATIRRRRRPFSKLTSRVLAVNVLALLILVGGLLYLGRYEDRLIQAELDALRTEALIFSGALGEGAIDGQGDEPQSLDAEMARSMVRRLYETTDTRTRLFGVDGSLIVDSRVIGGGPGGTVEVQPLPPPEEVNWLRRIVDRVYDTLVALIPERRSFPEYAERPHQRAGDYESVVTALNGEIGRQIWAASRDELVLGVAVPVQRVRVVHGALLLTRDNESIRRAVQSVREDILKVFGVALAFTVLMSVYLAGSITRPIRRLAEGAEQVRRGHGRQNEIPDFSQRRDEIGELSGALRDMTSALWARMDAIERFAADVAHEIKNPLTSLRSAVETTARVTDPEQQRKLMAVIVEDVHRLNRLISDISDASRLDAELSRAEAETVSIAEMLPLLADLYRSTLQETGTRIKVDIPSEDRLPVAGLESRLFQVFRNLVANAISFSPENGVITVRARRCHDARGDTVEITVEDQGPGIPPSKLEAIFDRFYSERPSGEKFGTHSGLGLSISKQIVEAHHGDIFAENRGDSGARFTVKIPALA